MRSIRRLSSSSSGVNGRTCRVYDLSALGSSSSSVDYVTAWRYQKLLAEHAYSSKKNRGISISDSLLLLEHDSIYTLGRGATLANIKFDYQQRQQQQQQHHKVIRVERGGEVTWHGPGQLVAYPILDLNLHKRDLHWYTHSLEETVIRAVDSLFSFKGERSDVNTGVWVGTNKVSAIGVTASRWITMHGCAVNICCDMSHFDRIVPCGIVAPGRGVTSLSLLIDAANATTSTTASDDGIEASLQLKTNSQEQKQQLKAVFKKAYLDAFQQVFSFDSIEQGRQEELEELLLSYPHIAKLQLEELFPV